MIDVSDSASHPDTQVRNAANAIKRSRIKKAVFKAVYSGHKKYVKVTDIMEKTGLSRTQVLKAGNELSKKKIFEKGKKEGVTAYQRKDFLHAHKGKILRIAERGFSERDVIAEPGQGILVVKVRKTTIPVKAKIERITYEELDQFKAPIKRRAPISDRGKRVRDLRESVIKEGFCKLIGEKGEFKDWGGEKNDLLSTKLRLHGKREAAAIAFKGKATTGVLTQKKMGTNGDQIDRLFESPADLFLVVYHGRISESVLKAMEDHASLLSYRQNRKIYFGVIDGDDLFEIVSRFPGAFGIK